MSATSPAVSLHFSSALPSSLVPTFAETKPHSEEKIIVTLPATLPDFTKNIQTHAVLEAILSPSPVNLELSEDDCCPITHCLMYDPVTTCDGQIYEREAIQTWLETHDTSPLAGNTRLKNKELLSIVYVKNNIHKFIKQNPAVKDSQEWYLPKVWVNELADACKAGDEEAIRRLVSRDRRLLVHTFGDGAYEGKTAVELAAAGALKALEVVIELLEKREPGLGLAALLQANKKRALPFYLDKQQPVTLLTLMAWMSQQINQIDRRRLEASVQNAKDAKGNFALHLAAAAGSVQVLHLLLEHKAELEAVNDAGQTALHAAAAANQVNVLRILLARQAKLNALDKEGNTLLHAAAQAGASEAVAFLLGTGLSAIARNERDQSARQLTEANKHRITPQQFDQIMAILGLGEEDVLKEQGVLGVFLLKQQRLIAQMASKLEAVEALSKLQSRQLIEQANKLEMLQQQLAVKVDAQLFEALRTNANRFFRSHGSRLHPLAAAVEKESLQLMALQGKLVKACEAGDEKQASKLLVEGAKGDLCNEQGVQPLGAAVWGMNPEVVNLVIGGRGAAMLTWEECEAHNLKVYNEVFMFEAFVPKTYRDWCKLLLKMERSPFLAAVHLVEVNKVWHDSDTSSWQRFCSYIGKCARIGAGNVSEAVAIKATNDYYARLGQIIVQSMRGQKMEHS